MKREFFIFVLLASVCVCCTRHFGVKDPMLRHLPKVVPELVMREYADNDIRTPDTIYFDSYHCLLSFFLVSKHEITNKQFCYFLNEDSIRTNSILINTIIDLDHGDSKIQLQEGKYIPVKGYENYPVLRISWWGAKKYCSWLTDFVNKKRKNKNHYAMPPYRLPTEFEWLIASSSNGTYKYTDELMCDSADAYVCDTTIRYSHDVKLDTLNGGGIAGTNENVFEWTQDNFYVAKDAMYTNMFLYPYDDGITADALVRKHAYMENIGCGRLSRNRNGFYSDAGFRIVQVYLGKSSGVEF